MPPSSPPGNRSFGLEGAGKGDSERSSKWRDNYPDINWPGVEGLVKRGAKLVKVYGSTRLPQEITVQRADPPEFTGGFGV